MWDTALVKGDVRGPQGMSEGHGMTPVMGSAMQKHHNTLV